MSEFPPEPPPAEPEVTTAAALEPGADHPLRLPVTDDLQRSRLTVFFRLLLAIPHIIWLMLWTIAVFFVLIVAWVAALIKGRLPDGMHSFFANYLRYSTRLVTYPVDLHVDPPQAQSRWKILFRGILSIPAQILAWVFGQVLGIVAFLAWFVCLFIGRMPKGMEDLGVYCLRYQQQTYGYMMLLTERYPSLSGPTP